MKTYTYGSWARIGIAWLKIGGFLSIGFCTIGGILIAIGGILTKASLSSVLWIMIWMMAIGWAVGGILVNLFPNISIDEQGMIISYFHFWDKRIIWTDIITIQERSFLTRKWFIVLARRVSFWHKLIGLSYFKTFSPHFIIRSDITNADELIDEIVLHIDRNTR
ncbi:MAG: hypothetical protein K1X65_22075 [Caldilineales bacterium]|nr:hypothetical protein [Caldilineales bacterium]